jgi:spermidine synthase
MLRLLALGFISILSQVVLLRELSVAFYGIELIYILALGVWLLWTAAGSLAWHRRGLPGSAGIGAAFALFSLVLPLDVLFIRAVRPLFSAVPGAYLPFHLQMLALLTTLLPVGVLLGILFQWTARASMQSGKTLAGVYALESAGGIAGGLTATVAFLAGLQNFEAALGCAVFSLGAAFVEPGKDGTRVRYSVLRIVACLFLLVLLWSSGRIDRWATSWTHPQMAATCDSPYGRLTLERNGAQFSVFENDELSFHTEGTEAEELAHVAALQDPAPSEVLILGGGAEGTVREILQHLPSRVDYVELNPVLLTLLEGHMADPRIDALHNRSVRIHVGDPRSYLRTASVNYDLILVGMPEPGSGQANRFYTREFFRLCASRLKPGGIVGFRLASAENLWTPHLAHRTAGIHRALRAELPEVLVLPGSANIFLGSWQPLCRDPSLLASRLSARNVRASLVSAPYLHYLYTNDRSREIARILASDPAPENSDTRPICYQYTLMIWLSRFFAAASLPDPAVLARWLGWRSPGPYVLFTAGAAMWICGRRSDLLRRIFLVALAGFAGMVVETLLLIHYQVKSGVLYQNIGILLMSFMAGLAAGAYAVDRCWAAGRRRTYPLPLLRGLMLGFILLCGGLVLQFSTEYIPGLGLMSLLLATTGFLVASVFACASIGHNGKPEALVAPLYSADLAGGCFGSMAATLVLVPVIGLPAAALLLVPLLAPSLLPAR